MRPAGSQSSLYGRRRRFVGTPGYFTPHKFHVVKPPKTSLPRPRRRGLSGVTSGRRRSAALSLGLPRTRAERVYVQRYRKPRTTQTTGMVRQHGLVWGGRLFHSRSDFSRSLQAHGTSYGRFAKRHSKAAAGFTGGLAHTKPRGRR